VRKRPLWEAVREPTSSEPILGQSPRGQFTWSSRNSG
jgi:hypothetical protein